MKDVMKDALLQAIKNGFNSYTIDPFESYVWMPDVLQPIQQVDLPNQILRNISKILRVQPRILEQLMGVDVGYVQNIVNHDCEFKLEDQLQICNWFGFGANIFAMDAADIQTVIRDWASDLQ